MHNPDSAAYPAKTNDLSHTVFELRVSNHPGVMSHICNLFSRRAYNLEAIFCIPIEQGQKSLMLLKVNEEQKLNQVIKQLEKLEDVIQVNKRDQGCALFSALENTLDQQT